jgi:type I restriction enzyme S subunit
MVVEKGYKMTEVGVIPDDWDVQTFGDYVNYTKGFAFKSKDYKSDGIRIIRVSDTGYDTIKNENGIYINEEDANKFKNWELHEGDLIFSTVGSKPPMYDSMVGKVLMISKKYEGSLLNQNAVKIRAKSLDIQSQMFLINQFRTKRYLQHIEMIYRGNANQASITLKELFEFKFPLPNNKIEQTAIANALSDMDALIAQTEKLIEKKKALKQGVMQELLKPKEGWVTKKLGEVGKCLRGVSYNPEIDLHQFPDSSNYSLLRSNNIFEGLLELNNLQYVNRFKVKAFQVIKDSDIIICMANGSKQLVGKSAIADSIKENRYTFGAFMGCYRTFDSYNAKFIFAFMQTKIFRNHIDLLLSGSSINNLNPSNIESISIKLPDLNTQNKIAEIIDVYLYEIKVLSKKLQKLKLQKQGMMQALLTGKIRLI